MLPCHPHLLQGNAEEAELLYRPFLQLEAQVQPDNVNAFMGLAQNLINKVGCCAVLALTHWGSQLV
jgi:hypothetical protein